MVSRWLWAPLASTWRPGSSLKRIHASAEAWWTHLYDCIPANESVQEWPGPPQVWPRKTFFLLCQEQQTRKLWVQKQEPKMMVVWYPEWTSTRTATDQENPRWAVKWVQNLFWVLPREINGMMPPLPRPSYNVHILIFETCGYIWYMTGESKVCTGN